jgi:hypothetical protein
MTGDIPKDVFHRWETGGDRTNVCGKRVGAYFCRMGQTVADGDNVVDGQYVRSCMLLLVEEKNIKRGFL